MEMEETLTGEMEQNVVEDKEGEGTRAWVLTDGSVVTSFMEVCVLCGGAGVGGAVQKCSLPDL